MRIKCLISLVIGTWTAATPLAAGTIIFSNLVGNCCGGYLVGGSPAEGGPETLAVAFTPGGNYLMTDAQVEVSSSQGDPSFNVSLYADAGTSPAGLIATFGADLAAPELGGIVIASGATAPLTAGVQYWLVLSPFDGNSYVDWEEGGSSLVPSNSLIPPGTWSPFVDPRGVQLQIDGAAVPEPASWTSATIALALIAGTRRRR
ncbi:MAG: choice-of-anchor R domain-containing protein [Bryobacteraceae bacterium]|jgi:hypothetical protein